VQRDVDSGAQVNGERRSCHKTTTRKYSLALRTPSVEGTPWGYFLSDHCDRK
jgi:hypothetical protein